jgi:hypothetical protein
VNVHIASVTEAAALVKFMHSLEPVNAAILARCAGGCGRQVPHQGALCIRCANRRVAEPGESS